jgi:hypothetical protein
MHRLRESTAWDAAGRYFVSFCAEVEKAPLSLSGVGTLVIASCSNYTGPARVISALYSCLGRKCPQIGSAASHVGYRTDAEVAVLYVWPASALPIPFGKFLFRRPRATAYSFCMPGSCIWFHQRVWHLLATLCRVNVASPRLRPIFNRRLPSRVCTSRRRSSQ